MRDMRKDRKGKRRKLRRVVRPVRSLARVSQTMVDFQVQFSANQGRLVLPDVTSVSTKLFAQLADFKYFQMSCVLADLGADSPSLGLAVYLSPC